MTARKDTTDTDTDAPAAVDGPPPAVSDGTTDTSTVELAQHWTDYSGDGKSYLPGDTVTVPRALASVLIDQGYVTVDRSDREAVKALLGS